MFSKSMLMGAPRVMSVWSSKPRSVREAFDDDTLAPELVQHLTAGATGVAWRGCASNNGHSLDDMVRAVLGDHAKDGIALGAHSQPIGGVFDVAAGDDAAVVKQKGCSDGKSRIRRIGVFSNAEGLGQQFFIGELGHLLLPLFKCANYSALIDTNENFTVDICSI